MQENGRFIPELKTRNTQKVRRERNLRLCSTLILYVLLHLKAIKHDETRSTCAHLHAGQSGVLVCFDHGVVGLHVHQPQQKVFPPSSPEDL